jgi:hypothetical protein
MSAFADRPDHLFTWLRKQGIGSGADCPTELCFIPRSTYGDYISDLVEQTLASGVVRSVRDLCVDVVESADSVALRLGSGREIVANRSFWRPVTTPSQGPTASSPRNPGRTVRWMVCRLTRRS